MERVVPEAFCLCSSWYRQGWDAVKRWEGAAGSSLYCTAFELPLIGSCL